MKPVPRALLVLLLAATPLGAARAAELLRVHAGEAAQARVAAPDRFEVLSYRFGGGDPVNGGRLEVEPLDVSGPNASGIVHVRFRLRVDGSPRGEARATVRGRVMGPALVARGTLGRGKAVAPQQVEVVDSDLTRLTSAPLRSVEQLAGQVPTRTIGVGRVLTADLVSPEPLVRRGDVAELVLGHHSLKVTASARVLGDAVAGARVLAEYDATGAVLLTEVLPDGTLRVLRRASRGERP